MPVLGAVCFYGATFFMGPSRAFLTMTRLTDSVLFNELVPTAVPVAARTTGPICVQVSDPIAVTAPLPITSPTSAPLSITDRQPQHQTGDSVRPEPAGE